MMLLVGVPTRCGGWDDRGSDARGCGVASLYGRDRGNGRGPVGLTMFSWWRRYRAYTESLISAEKIAAAPITADASPYSPPVRFLTLRVFCRASIAIVLNDPLRFVALCAADIALLWLPAPYGLAASASLALGAIAYNGLRAYEITERLLSYPVRAPRYVPANGLTPARITSDLPARYSPDKDLK